MNRLEYEMLKTVKRMENETGINPITGKRSNQPSCLWTLLKYSIAILTISALIKYLNWCF